MKKDKDKVEKNILSDEARTKEPQVSQEVQRLLELLRSQVAEERLQAATELKSIGVRARGAVRTRGAVTRPATKPIEELDLTPAMEALADARWDIRREVALAVGEFHLSGFQSFLRQWKAHWNLSLFPVRLKRL